MKSLDIEVGNIVRDYRVKAGLTQMDLAKNLGYNTPQFVSLFERGVSKIPLETLGQLIVLLSIPERKVVKALLHSYEALVISKLAQGKSASLKHQDH